MKIETCLCNNGVLNLRYSKNGTDIYECNYCKLLTVRPLPAKEELKLFYDRNYSSGWYVNRTMEYAVKLREETFRNWFKLFAKFLKKGDRLLDVGCGDGTGMVVAEEFGYEVFGNDISEIGSKNVKVKWNGRVQTGISIDKTDFPKSFFNCITMFDFIEHTPDPFHILEFCHTLLKAGGLIIIATHDGGSLLRRIMGKEWSYLNPDEHLNIFSKKTLQIFLEKAKFKVEIMTNVPKMANFEFIYNELKFTSKSFYYLLKLLKKVVPDPLWWKKIKFYPGEILCVAKKV